MFEVIVLQKQQCFRQIQGNLSSALVSEEMMIPHMNTNKSKFRSDNLRTKTNVKSHFFKFNFKEKSYLFTVKIQTSKFYL